jgi:hypothetical protein
MRKLVLTALAFCFLPHSIAVSQDQGKTGVAARVSAFDAAQLEERLRKLGPGDLSVITASASKPGSAMTTSPGSPNDALWSDMEKVGWTKRVSPFEGTPNAKELGALLRMFELTEEGAKAVVSALARIKMR